MTRRVSPKMLARQDQIIAFLADQPLPVSTGDVCKAIDTVTTIFPCICRCGHRHEKALTHRARNSDVTPILKRLERDGKVERFVLEGHRSHYWRLIGVPAEAQP